MGIKYIKTIKNQNMQLPGSEPLPLTPHHLCGRGPAGSPLGSPRAGVFASTPTQEVPEGCHLCCRCSTDITTPPEISVNLLMPHCSQFVKEESPTAQERKEKKRGKERIEKETEGGLSGYRWCSWRGDGPLANIRAPASPVSAVCLAPTGSRRRVRSRELGHQLGLRRVSTDTCGLCVRRTCVTA